MTGFELRTSGIGRDRSTNWATTTATSKILETKNISEWEQSSSLLSLNKLRKRVSRGKIIAP